MQHECTLSTPILIIRVLPNNSVIPTELKIAKQCFVGLFYFGFIFGKYMVLFMIFVLHVTEFEFIGTEWSPSKNIVISNGAYKSR